MKFFSIFILVMAILGLSFSRNTYPISQDTFNITSCIILGCGSITCAILSKK